MSKFVAPKNHTYLTLEITYNQKDKIDLIEYTEGGDFWNSITKKFRYFS